MIVPRLEWLDENSDLYTKEYIKSNMNSWLKYQDRLEAKSYKTKHKEQIRQESIELCQKCVDICSQLLEKYREKHKDFYKKSYTNKRDIISENLDTGETLEFVSKNAAAKHFKCSPAMVYFICEGKNNVKTLKKGGVNVTFRYAQYEPDSRFYDSGSESEQEPVFPELPEF